MKNLLYLLHLIVLVIACKPSTQPVSELKPEEQDFYATYINAHTPKLISRTALVQFSASKSPDLLEEGDDLDPNIFRISPKIDGALVWDGWRTFKFIPDEYLPFSKEYTATIDLAQLYDDIPSEKKYFTFTFRTHDPTIYSYRPTLYPVDPEKPELQELRGRFKVNDIFDLEDLKKCISATQDGSPLEVELKATENPKEYTYTASGIARTEEDGEAFVIVDGSPIKSESSNKFRVEVPTLNDFKVTSIQTYSSPERYIEVNFSDYLDKDQDLTGLVRLSTGQDIRTVRSGNALKLYPRSRIDGGFNVIVDASLKNVLGYQLTNDYNQRLAFTTLLPQVKAIQAGNIMPTSDQGLIFPFQAVSLHSVEVSVIQIFEDNIAQFFQLNELDEARELSRVGRLVYRQVVPLGDADDDNLLTWQDFAVDLSKMFESQPGAVYRVQIRHDKSMSRHPDHKEFQVDERTDDLLAQGISEFDQVRSYYDYYYYDEEYYEGDRYDGNYSRNQITRNVVASDVGIIAKRTKNNKLHVAVTDLKSTLPSAGVRIGAFNLQGQLIEEATTSDQGFAEIQFTQKPFYLEARSDNQVGYLKLDDGNALSMSMFDVSGGEQQRGLKGLIYQERGVSRPGDSLYLTFILDDRDNPLPPAHPVVMELYDPKNQLVERQVNSDGVNNFYAFKTSTNQDALTGNWLAKINVGGASFSKTIKIETIKPNRLKINLDFPGDLLATNRDQQGALDVAWLHGAVAKNVKSDVELTLKSGNTAFDGYDEYHFDDLAKVFESSTSTVFDNNVNAEGKATVDPALDIGQEAPGMIDAYFKVRAFENGGNFSIMQFKEKVSPFASYVGVKIPEGSGWRGALESNSDSPMSIVTLDQNGQPVDRTDLKIEIFNLRWSWWWERSGRSNIRDYVADRSRNLIQTKTISTKNGKAVFNFNLGRNDWGRKLIKITDPVSGHSTAQVFYTDYSGWWDSGSADFQGAEELLTFKTNKDDYKVGEMIDLVIPKTKEGRALISIENGTDILEKFWVEINESSDGKVSIPVSKEMAPNVYVHVSLIQPHAQKSNDRPIRLYGVQRINVLDESTKIEPILDVASEIRPDTDYEISIKERNGKAMTYTLAVVDDGILDLTRFKTPQPWNTMYAREALGVMTWDMYQDVIGAYSGSLTQLLAIGGDEFGEGASNKKANRFKPVVSFIGPFDLGKGGKKTHKLHMPNYVGSVRVMAVAGDPRSGAYGNAQKTVPVKKPLMVATTLPRVLSPSETMNVPITVFAMDKKIKNVTVEVVGNDLLQLDQNKQVINFSDVGDQVVNFPLKVKDVIGIGKIMVKVTSGSESASEEIELDIRIPNPVITKVEEYIVDRNATQAIDYEYFGVGGTNKGVLELSTMPPLNLEKRLRYLIRYPHGCVEQTTSAAFPQVFLPALAEVGKSQLEEIQLNIDAALKKLRNYQNSNGGFSYWPGGYDANYWGTSYVGHFMLAAERMGYALPVSMKDEWVAFQQNTANNWSNSKPERWRSGGWQLDQAYRLYTLALAGQPALGAMNRLRGVKELSYTAKWKLAGAYALAGKPEVAKTIIANLDSKGVKEYDYHSRTYGSGTRDLAMILDTKTELGQRNEGLQIVKQLAERLSSQRWYSTQTTAYTLSAIAQFMKGSTSTDDVVRAKLKIAGQPDIAVEMNKPIQLIELPIDADFKGNLTLEHQEGNGLFVRLSTTGAPKSGDEVASQNNLDMTVSYRSADGQPLDFENIPQGSDIIAEISVKNPGNYYSRYNDLALTQVVPSGWEISNTRMDESASEESSDEFDYQDIRDDRVMTYFDLNRLATTTVKLKLTATYSGRYYLPGVFCEAMYDNAISATQKGQWINIVEQ